MSALTTTKKLKWLFSLVLIFGGFTIYKLFDVLADDFAVRNMDGYSRLFQNLDCFYPLSFLLVIFIIG